MNLYIIDDGTLDTVVKIVTKHGQTIQRYDTEYRFSFDADPDDSTQYFLEYIRDEQCDSLGLPL
jgi:hypothetical protein